MGVPAAADEPFPTELSAVGGRVAAVVPDVAAGGAGGGGRGRRFGWEGGRSVTRKTMPSVTSKEVRVFVSYSHKDSYWMDALMPLLRFSGVAVRPWNDKEIKPGVRWDEEIKDAL